MSNPNNAVGTNAAYSGRTSVNAFNDDLAAYTSGVLSGWACLPSSGLTVTLGGEANIRDVSIAEDNAGNKTTVNNISGAPISVTISTPPVSNSRIDSIVAYVDNPPEGVASTADNPAACGLITVEGTAASTPVAPNDSAIRTAITADGASGSTAYYVVLANITVASGVTDLDATMITAGASASIGAQNIDFATLNFGNYSTTEVYTGFTWVDGKKIYKKTINMGHLPNNDVQKNVPHNISNLGDVINIEGMYSDNNYTYTFPINLPSVGGNNTAAIRTFVNGDNVVVHTGMDRHLLSGYVTLYYTKTT